jgi:hypothetical protein
MNVLQRIVIDSAENKTWTKKNKLAIYKPFVFKLHYLLQHISRLCSILLGLSRRIALRFPFSWIWNTLSLPMKVHKNPCHGRSAHIHIINALLRICQTDFDTDRSIQSLNHILTERLCFAKRKSELVSPLKLNN